MGKVIDLFSGVGGLSLGFRLAGYDVVLANEVDNSIAESYQRNHPHTQMINEDITKIDIASIFSEYVNTTDIIVGGPPCQGFSQKGQRKTINDPRNFLFNYYFKVVEYVRPRFFVIENVPNILTAEKGFFKQEITELFQGIGYSLSCKVLNAADYGVPQNRHRAFIIGNRIGVEFEFPPYAANRVSVWEAISDLNFLESGEGEFMQEYKVAPLSSYQARLREGSTVLYNHQATSHSAEAIFW